MWLLVGLGNPGPEYESTLHNLGFMVVDRLGSIHGVRITRKDSMALTGVGRIRSEDVMLAKPQTYMNHSGSAVRQLMQKHQFAPDRLLVIYDELDLPWTGLRIRPAGSAAGNHGMESVIGSLGTNEFARVRLGIHPGHPIRDGAEFVLSPIRGAQKKDLDEFLDHASGAVESVLAEGVEKSMAKYNRRARGLQKEER